MKIKMMLLLSEEVGARAENTAAEVASASLRMSLEVASDEVPKELFSWPSVVAIVDNKRR